MSSQNNIKYYLKSMQYSHWGINPHTFGLNISAYSIFPKSYHCTLNFIQIYIVIKYFNVVVTCDFAEEKTKKTKIHKVRKIIPIPFHFKNKPSLLDHLVILNSFKPQIWTTKFIYMYKLISFYCPKRKTGFVKYKYAISVRLFSQFMKNSSIFNCNN